MYRVLKVGNEVLTNVEDHLYDVDDQGNVYPVRKILPDTKAELIKVAQDTILFLQRQRLQEILSQYGYNSLGDVNFYVSRNDTEAQAIANWYEAYDTEVWNYIDSLNTKTKSQILADLQDMIAVEDQLFQSSIGTAPLP